MATANENRRAGIIYLKIDGAVQEAKGDFSYGLGKPKREAIVGADGVHGYKETPQVAFVEGKITDRKSLDVAKLFDTDSATVTLELNNGKTIILKEAWFAAEGKASTAEAEIEVRFEAKKAEEMK